jgi:hypothetical protein
MYLVPRGTPVDLQRGDVIFQHTTDRDFNFMALLAEGDEEFIFELDNGSQIAVAKSLVVPNSAKLLR